MNGKPLEARNVRWAGCAALVLFWAATASAASAADGAGSPAEASPEVRQLLAQGNLQLAHMQVAAAAESFRSANAVADGKCLACVLGLSRALPANAEEPIAATREAIKRLDGDPLLGRAYCQLGDLLLPQPAPSAAADAELAYEKAAGLGAAYRAEALVGMAEARLRRELYTQAVEAALQAIQAAPGGDTAGQARSTICRARQAGSLTSQVAPLPPAEPAIPWLAPHHAIPWLVPLPDPTLAGDGSFHLLGPVTKPRKIYSSPPIYPEAARKQKVGGSVIVEAIIDRDGCVVAPRILKSLPLGLDQAALTAVQKWVFAPAMLEGRSVKVYYTLTITFKGEPAPALGVPGPGQ